MQPDPNIIDAAIAVSMAFMALSLTLLVSALIGVLWKSRDTLGAIERLADTVTQEVGPTAVQLREVMDGVNQLRGATASRITAVSHKVDDVAGSVNTVVDTTKKHSSVWGTGLLAGFKAYLEGKPEVSDKQLTMDKGERRE